MRLVNLILLVGLLTTGGYFGYRYFFPGEEARIRQRMKDLAALVSLEPGAGNIRRGLMMEQFPRYFARDCEIKVYHQGSTRTMSGRSDMANAARYLAGLEGGLEVKFHDLSVTVEGTVAQGVLTMTMMQLATETLTAQVFQFVLVKEGGEWLVKEAKSVESLTR